MLCWHVGIMLYLNKEYDFFPTKGLCNCALVAIQRRFPITVNVEIGS